MNGSFQGSIFVCLVIFIQNRILCFRILIFYRLNHDLLSFAIVCKILLFFKHKFRLGLFNDQITSLVCSICILSISFKISSNTINTCIYRKSFQVSSCHNIVITILDVRIFYFCFRSCSKVQADFKLLCFPIVSNMFCCK